MYKLLVIVACLDILIMSKSLIGMYRSNFNHSVYADKDYYTRIGIVMVSNAIIGIVALVGWVLSLIVDASM